MNHNMNKNIYLKILTKQRPFAYAQVSGSSEYPGLGGLVKFYSSPSGVLVMAEIYGLPTQTGPCNGKIFGFHIHEGSACTGDEEDPFKDTGMHYNPGKCQHPYHAGDLPPLFSSNGNAWMVVLSQRLIPEELIGHTVIIHSSPDDFTTQPSGNSGKKIACGSIVKF